MYFIAIGLCLSSVHLEDIRTLMCRSLFLIWKSFQVRILGLLAIMQKSQRCLLWMHSGLLQLGT